MFTRLMTRSALGLACLTLMVSTASAQSPTSFADNGYERNAYNYSYISMMHANGLALVMSGDDDTGDVANLVADFCNSGFDACYDALMKNDDSLWEDAADDLEAALLWCDTLIVFAQNDYPRGTIQSINNLVWYLEIAIDNAHQAQLQSRFASVQALPGFWMPRW